jgi:hypothetical protein
MLLADEIRSHVEQHIGSIHQVLDEGEAGVRLLHVAPHDMRPVHTLVTAGISARAMEKVGKDAPRYIELMATLPRQWQLDAESVQQDRWAWPLRLLRALARRAHDGQPLAWGQLIANGEPPQPYADSTKQCATLIVPSLLVPTDFYQLVASARTIEFYAAVPLYREEWQLGREQGVERLMHRLVDRDVNDVIDPKRRNAAKKRFVFF